MRVIVTCGPSFEPIDQVRRLTNSSTGELGLLLASALSAAGYEVTCWKGENASSPASPGLAKVATFSTNDDLLEKLRTSQADAIFHAAALCDYRVKAATSGDGSALLGAKIATRGGEVTLTLEPTVKVLPRLRALFPKARIVGWKYELDGTREIALAKAALQLTECHTDACVLNGAAWGAGFGLIEPAHAPVEIADKPALAAFLARWLLR